MSELSFIAVDWGTSSFRLWGVGADGSILASTDGPFGMSQLRRSDFGKVLEDSLTKLSVSSDVPVVICGMAGAAQGWCEAPYLQSPTQLRALGKSAVRVRGIDRDVRILPGVKQMSPSNVMRGEETQIAGLLYHEQGFRGVVCLPGTHTKWVRVADQMLHDFETCMTGEQFAFFSKSSVLSHSMIAEGWSDAAYLRAVREALDDANAIPCKLFGIRAEMLVAEQSAAQARARLSGLLIGQELVATKAYWKDSAVALIGAGSLCARYQQALKEVGTEAVIRNSAKMTIAGLRAANETIEETVNVERNHCDIARGFAR